MKPFIFQWFLYMFRCNGPWHLIPPHCKAFHVLMVFAHFPLYRPMASNPPIHYETHNFPMVFAHILCNGTWQLIPIHYETLHCPVCFCAFSVAVARATPHHVPKEASSILAMVVIGPPGALGPLVIRFVILSQKVLIALQRQTSICLPLYLYFL